MSSLRAANQSLADAGFGPENFSVACYANGVPAFAALHAWGPQALLDAIAALPGVKVDAGQPPSDPDAPVAPSDPVSRTQALISAQGARWGDQAPPMIGKLVAGKMYRWDDGTLWSCIQPLDRAVYSASPSTYPAQLVPVRQPGVFAEWVQPLSTNPYRLVDPFTGKPQGCTHNGKFWVTTVDNNVWEPGVQGSETLWQEVDAANAQSVSEQGAQDAQDAAGLGVFQ